MTRDEAERLSRSLIGAIDANKCEMTDRAYLVTNVFVALGMLKLDEPKSAREKFKDEMLKLCLYPHDEPIMLGAMQAFDTALK